MDVILLVVFGVLATLLAIGAVVGWLSTLESNVIRYLASHPWLVFWGSYLEIIPAALLYTILPTTGFIFVFAGLVVIYASAIQGLRVTWYRSSRRALWVLGASFCLLALNAVGQTVRTGDLNALDIKLTGILLVIPLWVSAAWIAQKVAVMAGGKALGVTSVPGSSDDNASLANKGLVVCPSCQARNYAYRQVCLRCHTKLPSRELISN
jgi:uncharacterized paraquat-inducible protein A